MSLQTKIEVGRMANIESALWIAKDVDEERHLKNVGSAGRTRTYDPPVNSRLLYH